MKLISRCFSRSRSFPLRLPLLSSTQPFRYYSNPAENSDGTPQQYHAEKSPIIANLWGQRTQHEQKETALLRQHKIPTEPVLLEKEVRESRHFIVYDFQTNESLRHLYNDASGNILIGKLFEDLDALAWNIAFKHCDDNNPTTQAPNLVTVSVDKIIQTVPLSVKNDLVVFGQIAWVGRSSMDILMKAYYKQDLKGDLSDGMPPILDSKGSGSLLTCVFTFVARSGRAGHAVQVNKLLLGTLFEIEVFKIRAKKAQLRNQSAKNNKIQVCQKSLTQLVERGSAMLDMPALAHPNAVLMRQTSLENSFICQPQNVNLAGTVFGGFLMHRAYDLAVATCYTFGGTLPHLLEVDKIEFRRPVDIGDLMRLKSRVVYASDDPVRPTAHVEVTCQVVRPERASSFVSNTFHFIFGFSESVTLRRILPISVDEAATLLEASAHTPHESPPRISRSRSENENEVM